MTTYNWIIFLKDTAIELFSGFTDIVRGKLNMYPVMFVLH